MKIYCFYNKGTRKFLTIVDMKSQHFDFNDLDKYILTALLQCNIKTKNNYVKFLKS